MLELLQEIWSAHGETLSMLATFTTLFQGFIAFILWIWKKINEYFYF
ncbi:MAG: hypothetical protein IJ575_09960 [Selenomonadaceae bacterium]|nr:hypothetical protein [Selenomonadaceae bacterium]